MLLIPVIDLMRGQVVHARRGERDNYRPILSSLCAGSNAMEIVAALLALHPFSILYIADLDAIQNNGKNINIIKYLHNSFAGLTLWLDAGISDAASFATLAAPNVARIVIGSETLRDTDLLQLRSENKLAKIAPVLSLDFHGEQFRGASSLQRDPNLWPDDVIVMTLARVGADNGPDFERLAQFLALAQQTAPHKKIYAAGGVRHVADLHRLRDMGVSGALIASALHDGRITRDDLKNFAA
jgi:phosphoribosylformimino-5-aminoimidazole carboxamide ribotide isomerase